MNLSHLDENNNPSMVDVSGKSVTVRVAKAQAVVDLPPEVMGHLQDGEIQTSKGAVFQCAIIAGTAATKKTWDLIPLCHPIGLDSCKIVISAEASAVVITSECKVEHRTGVEMESLTAVSIAALTIYDMCKGLSHDIVIKDIRLLEKTGGKTDYKSDA